MEFIKRNVNKTQRNGQITIPKNVGVVNNSILSTVGGNYLPALANEDGSYTVDLTNVLFTGNLTAAGEVAAYKGGNSEGGNYVSVYDGLDSTDPSIALSANQGRILRELINNLSDEGLPTFLIDQLTLADELILKYDSEKQAWVNSDSIELDDYYNKEEVNTLIDDIKAGNVDLANYYTKSEIDTKIEEIDLSDYYTKSEIDSHTENTTIHITGSERSSWNGAVEKAHTHENKSVLDGISSTKVSKWDNTSTNFGDWFYKDNNGKVHSRYSFVGDSEISAHGSGEDESFTVIDNLLSTSTTSALSANQGRLLKLMIDNIGDVDLSNYYNKSEVDKLIGDIQAGDVDLASYYNKTEINLLLQSYATVSNLNNLSTSVTNHIGDTTKHITATERTNWDTAYTNSHTHSNKAALDAITSTKINNWDLVVENWDSVFEINSDGDLLVKVNVIGELEISAYGAGESTGGGAITVVDGLTSTSKTAALSANLGRVLRELIDNIDSSGGVDLSGYYNKTEIDTKLNGKADSVHNHTISLVTGLQSALDNKSNTDHKHDNYLDLTTEQTITGRKTFDNGVVINTGNSILDENGWGILGVNPTGWTGLPNDGSAIGLGTGASSVYIRTDGDLYHYNKTDGEAYPIIDSNTIGNYKSGDSDKLDGYDLRSNNYTKNTIETKLTYLMDLTSLSTSTFYPVTFSSSPKTLHCEIYSVGGNSSVAYNCNKLGFSFSGQGWSDCPQGLTVHFYSCYSASETTIGCIAMGQEGGVKCVWLRGGVNYYICANQTPTLRTSTYTNGNEKFVTGTSLNGGSNTKVTTYWTPLTTSGLGTLYHSGGIATGGGLSISGNASMAGTLTTTGLATFNGNFSAPAGTTGNMVSNSFLFRNGCTIEVSKAGWYRFAVSTAANNASGNYIFSIRRSYYNTNNESYVMMANIDYNGCNWTLLGGHFNTLLITKIRCTYTNNSTMYFDFYYDGTALNVIYINSIGNCTLQTPTLVTSALSVTNETSLTNGFKTGCKTAYPITIYRNATNGGAYIQYGANNLLTKTWAAGSDTSNSFAWYYKDTSAGTDVCKMKLDPTGILSSDYWLLNNTSANPYLKLTHTYNSATTNWYLQAYNGYLYMGQGSAKSLRVDSSGNCLSVGEVTAHSDKRLKSDIKPLEVRGELNPVTYVKDGKESIGFIADEVKEVYPELVITDESTDEKYLSLNYAQLTAVLYAEIKELKKEIAELKKKIE